MYLLLDRLMTHPSYSPVQKSTGKFGALQVTKVLSTAELILSQKGAWKGLLKRLAGLLCV